MKKLTKMSLVSAVVTCSAPFEVKMPLERNFADLLDRKSKNKQYRNQFKKGKK